MAIQIPNPGTGNGATGDNEFVLWSKVKDNFNNTSHAANRLVGNAAGNLPELTNNGIGTTGLGGTLAGVERQLTDYSSYNGYFRSNATATDAPEASLAVVQRTSYNNNAFFDLYHSITTGGIYTRVVRSLQSTPVVDPWMKVYTSGNTTIEDGTNYLKVASPILRLQHNSFKKEHEAEKMDIAVESPSVGVYKITGSTGLRNDGTWYFSPPKDEHNNVLCMVEVSEQDGVITVNTYKKKFDFETVSIVPDYEQPTDIPEGAIVMLRFNDLPQEQLDEPIE